MCMAEQSVTSASKAISLAMTTTFKYMMHQEYETSYTKTNYMNWHKYFLFIR